MKVAVGAALGLAMASLIVALWAASGPKMSANERLLLQNDKIMKEFDRAYGK